jgi:hypothetical protein
MSRHSHQPRLGRMLELSVARPLPIQVPPVRLNPLDDLAYRHGVVRYGLRGIGLCVYGSSWPQVLRDLFRRRRLMTTSGARGATSP